MDRATPPRFWRNAELRHNAIGGFLLNHASEELQTWLATAGFTVHQTPTGEFLKAGCSAKCLSLSLKEN